MHGAVTQRSSPGLHATHFLDGSSHSSSWSSEVLAKSLGFQRRHFENFIPRKQKSTVRPFFIKAATTSGSGRHITPLQPESPTGQFLIELLHSHPHLVSAAAEQQLDKLTEDRMAAESQEHSGSGSSDAVLYKRIAELKAQERHTTVEEILYALVSHRFVEAKISMLPAITSFKENERVDNWPAQERELQSVHSREALEMVWEHLAFILGVKGASEGLDDSIMVQLSRFHMGQVYVTSALYGYFLRRVDEKFQMEKILSPSTHESDKSKRSTSDVRSPEDKDAFATDILSTLSAILGLGDLRQDRSFANSGQSKNHLRNYLLSFEADTLFRCVTVRSIESACIIERHTEALFGKPDLLDDLPVSGKEVVMMLSLAGLKRLVLEAVAFGSFLWDAETLVDSHYTIVTPEKH